MSESCTWRSGPGCLKSTIIPSQEFVGGYMCCGFHLGSCLPLLFKCRTRHGQHRPREGGVESHYGNKWPLRESPVQQVRLLRDSPLQPFLALYVLLPRSRSVACGTGSRPCTVALLQLATCGTDTFGSLGHVFQKALGMCDQGCPISPFVSREAEGRTQAAAAARSIASMATGSKWGSVATAAAVVGFFFT